MRLKALVWILRRASSGEPEVLLLQRPVRRGGGEHPVTGKGDEGESAAQTAAREAEEETGLRGEVVDLQLVHSYDGKKGAFEEHAFLLRAPAGAAPRLSDEHVAHRWASPDDARAAVRWNAHRDALEQALKLF